MPRVKGCEAVYEVAEQWKERCLEQDGSLMWPDLEEPTWTVENLEACSSGLRDASQVKTIKNAEIRSRFGSYDEAVKRVVADINAIWSLCASGLLTSSLLEWAANYSEWATSTLTTFDAGEFLGCGLSDDDAKFFKPGLHLQRSSHFQFIAEASLRLKKENDWNEDRIVSLLKETSKEIPRSQSSLNLLLHLLHPDRFEPIFNNWAKTKITSEGNFSGIADHLEDVDDKFSAIRKYLVESKGVSPDFSFYDDSIANEWYLDYEPSKHELIHFVDDDEGYLDWLQANPDGFVLNAARKPKAIDFVLHLTECRHFDHSGLVKLTGEFTKTCSTDPSLLFDWATREAGPKANVRLCTSCRPRMPWQQYWWVNQGNSYSTEREGGYIWAGRTNRAGNSIWHHETMKELRVGDLVVHYANGAFRSVSTVMSEATVVDRPSQRQPEPGSSDGYSVKLDYLDFEPPIELLDLPIAMRSPQNAPFTSDDRVQQVYLAAVSDNWMSTLSTVFHDRWPPSLVFRPHGLSEIACEGPSFEDFALLSYSDLDEVQQILMLLRSKHQLIFEGPPGCGKTFLADLFARYLTKNPLDGDHNEQVEFVQFHQSYGYEDFVEGIRPVTDENGRLQYRVVPGIFLRMCDRAAANPDKDFVLVIDEINRGNLSRIFGELMMALEYRDKKVKLPYSSGDDTSPTSYLQIPKNLYLIGTMNSTDRSLAMIDYALRRRFYFYPLRSVEDGNAPVLRRWLDSQSFDPATQQQILSWFNSINAAVTSRLSDDFQIGHSYFMNPEIDKPEVQEEIWRYAILPLLQEYFHGDKHQLAVIQNLGPA